MEAPFHFDRGACNWFGLSFVSISLCPVESTMSVVTPATAVEDADELKAAKNDCWID